MNAETRAKELFPLAFGETLSPEQAAFRDRIATAIRSAENDKLEEAALAAEQSHLGMSCFVDAVDCGQFNSGVRHAAKAIRDLIEKD